MRSRSVLVLVFGVVVCAASVFFHLYDLGHPALAPWDEAVHAAAARSTSTHPLQPTPTLYEHALLSPPVPTADGSPSSESLVSDVEWNWANCHEWLHIPPLGIWASALSLRLLGVDAFALRLPGFFFVLLGLVSSFAVGRRLSGSLSGVLAAGFLGLSPFVLYVSQGYSFGDITETPLFGLVPAAAWALVRGHQDKRWRFHIVAGALQGLAYLAKGGLSLSPLGIALALCVLDPWLPHEEGWQRRRLRALGVFLLSMVGVVAPYHTYARVMWPDAHRVEGRNWGAAFFGDYEKWGRPWDYHFTAFLYTNYGIGLALVLVVCVGFVVARALAFRARADLVVVAWVASLYLPLSIAVTKAAPMTLAAAPAMGLAVAAFARAVASSPRLWVRASGVGLFASAPVAALLMPLRHMREANYAVTTTFSTWPGEDLAARVAPLVLELELALGITALAASVMFALARLRQRAWAERFATAALCAAAPALLLYWGALDWQIVGRPRDTQRDAAALGRFIDETVSQNATIVLAKPKDIGRNGQHVLMFWSGRDVYDGGVLKPEHVCAAARRAPIVVVTRQPYEGTPLGSLQGWHLYEPRCTATVGE